jgi:ribosomal protein S18 acetylase RimI-like enzyme
MEGASWVLGRCWWNGSCKSICTHIGKSQANVGNSIHHLGLVGHIEDIAVAKDQQGKKLGLKLIQALDFIAEKVGCYKCILDCSEANEGFYVKCGYKRAGLEMAHYYDGSTSKDMAAKGKDS